MKFKWSSWIYTPWLDNLDLEWEHSDPADRTIVAVATSLACPLISSDRVIADFYPKTIW
jgi:PIN domain nuclease of toxin-antitoxin system